MIACDSAVRGLSALLWPLLMYFSVASSAIEAAETVTWADIEPILQEKCVLCHSGDTAPVGLRLDSYEDLLAGSQRGPVVDAGAPAEQSELIRRLKGEALPRMPMTGPPFLTEDQIALFAQWIEAGLPKGESLAATASPTPDIVENPGEVTWDRVAPIFARRCVKCHTDSGLMGAAPEGYKLNSYDETLSFADRARVVPFRPEASELVRKIRGQSLPRMPFDGPPYLDHDEISLIEKWIDQGAKDSLGVEASIPVGAKVRLRGRLTARNALDGFKFEAAGDIRRDKDLMIGSSVELRGYVTDQGAVMVTRIKD